MLHLGEKVLCGFFHLFLSLYSGIMAIFSPLVKFPVASKLSIWVLVFKNGNQKQTILASKFSIWV